MSRDNLIDVVTPARMQAAIVRANQFIQRQPGSTAAHIVQDLRDIVADMLKTATGD